MATAYRWPRPEARTTERSESKPAPKRGLIYVKLASMDNYRMDTNILESATINAVYLPTQQAIPLDTTDYHHFQGHRLNLKYHDGTTEELVLSGSGFKKAEKKLRSHLKERNRDRSLEGALLLSGKRHPNALPKHRKRNATPSYITPSRSSAVKRYRL